MKSRTSETAPEDAEDLDTFVFAAKPVQFVSRTEADAFQRKFNLAMKHRVTKYFLPVALWFIPWFFWSTPWLVLPPFLHLIVMYTYFFSSRDTQWLPGGGCGYKSAAEVFDCVEHLKNDVVPKYMAEFLLAGPLLLIVVLLWASILSSKYLGIETPLFRGFALEPNPMLIAILYAAQISSVSMVVALYVFSMLISNHDDHFEKAREAAKRVALRRWNKIFRELHDDALARYTRFSDSEHNLIDTIKAIAKQHTLERFVKNTRMKYYSALMAAIALFLYPVCNPVWMSRAWHGSHHPFPEQGGEEGTWYPGDPAAILCYMFMSATVNAPCFYFTFECFKCVFQIYHQVIRWMNLLQVLPLDWMGPHQNQALALFYSMRKYFTQWEMPYMYARGEPSFGIAAFWGVVFSVFCVAEVSLWGTAAIQTLAFQLVTYLVIFFAVPLMVIMALCVEIWQAQQDHAASLQEVAIALRAQAKVFDEGIIENIDTIRSVIQERDDPPKLFGFSIRPTIYTIVQGYLVSALGLVVGQLWFQQ